MHSRKRGGAEDEKEGSENHFRCSILLFLVIQLYPVVWLFMASLKSSAELGSQPFALPKALVFSIMQKFLRTEKFCAICGTV